MNSRHQAICRKLLKLIESKVLLSGLKSSVNPDELFVVDSYAKAKILATRQYDIENPWLDLRSGIGAKIDDSQLDWDRLDSLLGKKLYDYLCVTNLVDFVGGDVEGDLFNICKDFGAPSPFHGFWNAVWNSYELGGWPCGWVGGIFPVGKLAVFDAKDWSM